MIDRAQLAALCSPAGEQALAAAAALEPRPEDYLAVYQRLRRAFDDGLARAAAEQAILRRRARAKFPAAGRMYFDSQALEQASAYPVAAYRAARLRGHAPLFDLTCGIGGDALALAEAAPVVALDLEAGRLRLARANARALDLAGRVHFLQADARRPPWRLPPGAAAFADPARRQDGRRTRHPDLGRPALAELLEWAGEAAALAVKLSPAIDLAALAHLPCEVEFIAVGSELREAVLWFGPLCSGRRRATVLPGPHTLRAPAEPELAIGPPARFLIEPNPAVMRAGMVRTLGAQLGAHLIDRTIAFLASESPPPPTPFAACYEVLEALPFQLKRLRAALRARGVGRVTVKTRGSPLEPQALTRSLRLRGDDEALVILTRAAGRPLALIARPWAGPRLSPSGEGANMVADPLPDR